MKNKKGFTLVELLAVIAILAILVIIALPNVINMYNKAQKETFLTEVKKIHSEAEKKYISSSINGNTIKTINSEDNSKLDMTGEKLQYCINLNNSGKVTSMKVSNGKWIASLENGKSIEDLTIDDLEDGNLDDYKCIGTSSVPAVYCTFDGELKQGAEYVNGQYTYRYMQEYAPNFDATSEDDMLIWKNISQDGWGVILTDKTSTNPVTTKLCTNINNKPVISMSLMFSNSETTKIDLSSFDTSNVINMDGMFFGTKADSLDLSTFNTNKVTSMTGMFMSSDAKTINGLSKFDTSKVTNMRSMFSDTKVPVLDLSSFNTSNVTNMGWMFDAASATEIKGLNKFNTGKVVEMSYMFSDVPTTVIDVSSFNTANVISMEGMFWGTPVTTLDLSSFDTSNVTKMTGMFYDCENLKTIYASDKFVTSNVISEDTFSFSIFRFNSSLVGGNGTKFDGSNYGKYGSGDIALARIDTASTPGYFTAK